MMDRGGGELDAEIIDRVLAMAFAEDVGDGDLTTSACVDDATRISARAVVREPGTVAGLKVFAAALQFGGAGGVDWKSGDGAVMMVLLCRERGLRISRFARSESAGRNRGDPVGGELFRRGEHIPDCPGDCRPVGPRRP